MSNLKFMVYQTTSQDAIEDLFFFFAEVTINGDLNYNNYFTYYDLVKWSVIIN